MSQLNINLKDNFCVETSLDTHVVDFQNGLTATLVTIISRAGCTSSRPGAYNGDGGVISPLAP